jgi:hypothetical protein
MVQDPRTGELKPGRIEQPLRSVTLSGTLRYFEVALLWRRKWSSCITRGRRLALFVSSRQTPSVPGGRPTDPDLGLLCRSPDMATQARMSSVRVAEMESWRTRLRRIPGGSWLARRRDRWIRSSGSATEPDPDRAQRLAADSPRAASGAERREPPRNGSLRRSAGAGRFQLRLGRSDRARAYRSTPCGGEPGSRLRPFRA